MADAINRLALYLYLCCCSQWASNPALFIILNHDADIADTSDANSIQGLPAPGTVEGDLQYRSQTQSEPQATYDTGRMPRELLTLLELKSVEAELRD